MKKNKAYKAQKEKSQEQENYFVPETQFSSPIHDGKNWINPPDSSEDLQSEPTQIFCRIKCK